MEGMQLCSENVANLFRKLGELQSLGTDVKKDSKNPFFKNSYASLNAHLEAIIPGCKTLGISFTQVVMSNHLVTQLVDSESGEWLRSYYPLNLKDKSPQEVGSQVTYARRYSLSAMFNMAAVDDDGNEASVKTQAISRPQPIEKGATPLTQPVKPVVDEKHPHYAAAKKKLTELGREKFNEWAKTQPFEFKV